MTDNTKNKHSSNLSKFNLPLIILIVLIAVIHERAQHSEIHNLKELVSSQNTEIQGMKESISSLSKSKLNVDFSVPGIQNISGGFLLSRAAKVKHLTGIKFSGRIINSMSVNHQNVTFIISVDDIDKEFTISKIISADSADFKVFIPNLKIENAKNAQIMYKNSSVTYRR